MTIKDISYFSHSAKPTGNESGRSLIEMLGTIAIITMITVGAISGAGVGMSMWKATQTKEDVMGLIVGLQDLYSWSRDGIPDGGSWGLDLCEQNLIDRECSDNTWTSAFNTPITVTSTNDVIKVTISGIPALACKQFGADGKIITAVKGTCGSRGNSTLIFENNPDEVE